MYKKLIIISIIICFLTLGPVSASWHGFTSYDDGDCELFSVSCPAGYKNGGELEYNSSIFISTEPMKFPYHAIFVEEIGEEDINNLYANYDIVDSVDNDDFKAYKLEAETLTNSTIALYDDGEYNYLLKIEHKGCAYDNNQFEEDINTLENIATSIYRHI